MQNEKAVPCEKQKSCKQKAVLSHPDMNPNAPERKGDWKVYFNGSLWGHHGRERAGREVSVQKWFQWAGRDWFVPSVYVCAKGDRPREIRRETAFFASKAQNDFCIGIIGNADGPVAIAVGRGNVRPYLISRFCNFRYSVGSAP